MQTETVTVQYVNPPKNNPNFGSIKTSTGEYISVPSSRLHEFAPNGVYTLIVEMNGRFKNFKDFAGQAEAPPTPQNYGVPPQPAQGYIPPPRNTPIMDTEAHKSENMAVMGIIGRCLHGTGQIPPVAQLEDMMRSIRQAWKASQQAKQTQGPMPEQANLGGQASGPEDWADPRGIPGDDWQQ